MSYNLKLAFTLLVICIATNAISQPPCPECDLDCIMCESLDGFTDVSSSPTPGTSLGTHCTLQEHQITWVGFIAGSEDLSLEVCAISCTGNTRLEIIIVDAVDCANAEAVSNCYGFSTAINPGQCRTVTTFTELRIGDYYWLVFDNTNGNGSCDYSISVTDGETGAPDIDEEPEIEGETALCDGDTESYRPDDQDGVTSYLWELDGDKQGESASFLFDEDREGVYELCATPLNFCNEGPYACIDIYVGESYDTVYYYEICLEQECIEFEGEWICDDGEEEVVEEETWLGCDSIIYVNIEYINEDNEEDIGKFEICEGEFLNLDDIDYFDDNDFILPPNTFISDPGEHIITVIDEEYDCEYLIELELFVLENDTIETEEFICDGDFYVIGPEDTIRTPGSYVIESLNQDGCVNIEYIELSVGQNSESSIDRTICKSQTIAIGDTLINTAGSYKIKLSSSTGCDSIIYAEINQADTIKVALNRDICQGDSFMFGDTTIMTSGTYQRKYLTASGCDSIETLALEVQSIETNYLSPTLCFGESYFVEGQEYDQTGIFEIKTTSVKNCDSLITLDLIIEEQITNDLSESICEGDSIIVGNTVYKEEGSYSLTVPAYNGCDSTIELSLRVSTNYLSNTVIEICEGDSILFEGNYYKDEDSYPVNLVSTEGCDSLMVLDLITLSNSSYTFTEEICEGDSYPFGNQDLTTEGSYDRIEQNKNNCDSIITLDLIVNAITETTVEQTLCYGDSVEFYQAYYKESGLYPFQDLSSKSCDSLVILDLTILEEITYQIIDTACNLQIIEFNGQEITAPGFYSHVATSQNGCDSTIMLEAIFEDCSFDFNVNLENNLCHGDNSGVINLDLIRFFPPLAIEVYNQNNILIYNDIIENEANELTLSDLSSNAYTIIIEDGLGERQTLQYNITQPEEITLRSKLSDFNGFNLRCSDSQDGEIELTIDGGSGSFKNFQWSDGNTEQNRTNLRAGKYTLSFTDDNDCQYIEEFELIAPPLLELDLDIELSDLCNPRASIINFLDKGGVGQKRRRVLNLLEEAVQPPYEAGEYFAEIIDENDCKVLRKFSIAAKRRLDIDLGLDLEIKRGQTVIISPESNFDIEKYEWRTNPTFPLSCNDCPELELTPEEDITVILRAFDKDNCKTTDSLFVKVNLPPKYYLPNALNLNDANNNRFNIFYNENIVVKEIKIFSRWGELVYLDDGSKTNDPNQGWDGTLNGQQLEQGVYIYTIFIEQNNGKQEILTGDITLIR